MLVRMRGTPRLHCIDRRGAAPSRLVFVSAYSNHAVNLALPVLYQAQLGCIIRIQFFYLAALISGTADPYTLL
jgi:hypothetical protein